MKKKNALTMMTIIAAAFVLTACNSMSVLQKASLDGDLNTVKNLLKKGEDINDKSTAIKFRGYTRLNLAINNGHRDVVDYLTQKGADLSLATDAGLNTLHIACFNGLIGMVEMLIEKRVDINAETNAGATPLHFAAMALRNNNEIIRILLKNGANINSNHKGNFGTPLHYAAKYGSQSVAKLLIDNGASVNAKDQYGNTPLHLAVKYGSFEFASVLIEHQSNVNATRNDTNQTPLHFAAINGRNGMIELLLQHGAIINQKDGEGENATDMAISGQRVSTVAFLKKNGGISNSINSEDDAF